MDRVQPVVTYKERGVLEQYTKIIVLIMEHEVWMETGSMLDTRQQS